LRGHGTRAREGIINASILEYVDELADWIQNDIMPRHDGLEPIIIGHSMGGLITQKLAERNLAYKVILLAPAPPKGIPLVFGRDFKVPIRDFITAGLVAPLRTSFRPSRKLVRSLFVEPEKNKDMIERCVEQRLHESPRALYEMLEGKIEVDRKKVTVPMLIIGFIRDHIITEHVVRRIGQYYGAVPATPETPRPFRELQIRADLGHLCPLEHEWERVAKKCLDWIT
jgi:alpha-beta hydrolase superfamily lysophospholipase